ncbi:UNVERIFIED_CONTAM: vancomycin resistance protein YoaR [Acetivibrio alkalicellulosi]
MMNPVTQKNRNKKKVFMLVILSVIATTFALFLIFSISVLSHKKVYAGVYINSIDVSKMTQSEVSELLKSSFTDRINEIELIVKHDDLYHKFDLSQFNISYDIENATNSVITIGRSGNIFKRFYEIFQVGKNGTILDIDFSYDESILRNSIEDFYNASLIEVQNPHLITSESGMSIYTGRPGNAIDKEKTLEIIRNSIKTATGGTFEVPVNVIEPSKINIEEIYSQVTQDAKNAYVLVEDNEVIIIPHVLGRQIDKSQLENIIKEFNDLVDIEKELPIEFIEPKIKTQDINEYLFRDQLSSYSTSFSTGNQNDANRGVNIRLASSKINGLILGPGDVFSFNDVVGPRTSQNGYQSANIYVNGQIIPGVGGGICQVSSTLYNAVLFGNLETVYRMNHMFTVGYVPYGQDAAVSFNELDFKFKNNTNWPIKIEATVTNNTVTYKIIGTNETPEKTIEIQNVQISSTPAPVKHIDDPNMEEGKSVVVQSGKPGYVIDTYKIIKINGVETERIRLHRSTYRPYEHQVRRGTKKVDRSDSTNTVIEEELNILEIPEDTIPSSQYEIDDNF